MATLSHVQLSSTNYFSHHHQQSPMKPASFFLLSSSLCLYFLHSIPVAAAQANSSGTPYPDTRVTPSMAIIIIILIFALFFMGFFSIYFRRCSDGSIPNGGSFRAVLGAVAGRSRRGHRGLDEATLNTYPTFVYSEVKALKIGKGALECAVCLNEFEDEDTLRLITKCDHVFHSDCIDAWLDSHVTCPVCRANLQQEEEEEEEEEHESPPPHELQIGIDSGAAGGVGEASPPEVMEPEPEPSVRQPRQHSRTVRSWSTPRFFGRYPRSHSTGHSLAQNQERYTLRLPENVRKELMGRSLKRGGSMVLARERSSRSGYRGVAGDGSGRGGSSRYRRLEHRRAKSDRWLFTVAPPFFSRWPSLKLHKSAAGGGEQSGPVAHKSWSTPLSGGGGGKVENSLDRGPRTSSGRVLV